VWRFIVLIFIFKISDISAQDDNILWASARIQTSFDENWSGAFRPIVRYDQDISNYTDFSTDFSLKYKMDDRWAVQFLDRHWFVQDATDRHFLWVEVQRADKWSDRWSTSSHLRLHYAMDIRDRVDPDFIRWDTKIKYSFKKVTPFIGQETFYRIDELGLNRIRWQLGVSYPITSDIKMINTFWLEDFSNDSPDFFIWGFILQYTL